MAKFKVSYYDIPYGSGIFATPEFTKSEIVDATTTAALDSYILTKTDLCGHKFKRNRAFGFDYTSAQGAVKVKYYTDPKIKKI